MTYAVVDDIAREFNSIEFTTTSSVTSDDVQSFIDQNTSLIDQYLAPVYLLPIVSVKALDVLKRIQIALVAARVAAIVNIKQNNQPALAKQELNKRNYADWAMMHLKELANRTLYLEGAELINSDYGMESYTLSNNIYPEFEKGVKQW
jgi:phage gp36-like protein